MNHILKGKEVIQVDDIIEWAKWYETGERHVANDEIQGVRVSTVFLGIDHNFEETGDPIVFETLVFGGDHDEEMNRYCTYAEAEEGHKKMCAMVFGV